MIEVWTTAAILVKNSKPPLRGLELKRELKRCTPAYPYFTLILS